MMRIDVVTIFPEMFAPVMGASMLKRAQEKRCVRLELHNPRRYTRDKHRTVDDRPYGGGAGMVMKPEPIFQAVEAIEARCSEISLRDMSHTKTISHACSADVIDEEEGRLARAQRGCRVVLMAPTGARLTQAIANELTQLRHLIIICGHYEGVDERVRQALVDREISIGDYVLTGGELPAMVLIDSVVRLLPGVLGHAHATHEESFVSGLLEYPQYTRPPVFRGMQVPEPLRSGHHRQVATWRKLQAVARTLRDRPDLAASRSLRESYWKK